MIEDTDLDNDGANDEAPEAAETPEASDLSTLPGFHVVRSDGVHLGTYETEADAQHFIDGHLVAQNISASIVHGQPAAE